MLTKRFFNIVQVDKSRIYGLDILRAFAILFVLIDHGKFLLPVALFPNKYFFFLKFSLDGVSMFFVLSGFLIGGILIKQFDKDEVGGYVLFNFWIKRWFRTLPNYFFILLVLMGISICLEGGASLSEVAKYFLFIQNFNSPHPDFFGEAWSLSVEEWFYIIIPSLVFICISVCKISSKKSILLTSILFLVIPLVFRYEKYLGVTPSLSNEWDAIFRKEVVTRLDSLSFGVIGAYLNYYHSLLWEKNRKILLLIGVIILISQKVLDLLVGFKWSFYTCVLYFTLNSIGTLFLLPYLSTIKHGKGKLYVIITFTSLVSYSMYLLNLSVVQYSIINKIEINWLNQEYVQLFKYLMYWVVTILLSTILYLFYEKPIMNIRDKFLFLRVSKTKVKQIHLN